MMIKITGSSGYLGKVITTELQKKNYPAEKISRELLYGPVEKLSEVLKDTSVLINLAGAPVLQRWTARNKNEIYSSRINTVQNLVHAIHRLPVGERPQKVISASAIGIYSSGIIHKEESKDFDTGFLGEVVKKWEEAWQALPEDLQLTIFRTALVLGKESVIIKKLILPFKLGLGGKISNGKQPFPFIHEADVVQAFLWAITTPDSGGVFNLAAPQQITNSYFTQVMAKKLNRPAIFTIPTGVLKLLYGKAASMLTHSPAVMPQKLIERRFTFQYLTIDKALENILA
ncbi:MAG: TIGR01777 family oxidoreductase [Mariniphaga sp.]